MSKVSVIMPAYNAAKYIAESIESVVRQTYTNWELIIVDDGSSDNTASVVKSFVSHDSRIKYVWQENGKQGKARNTAIANSKGEYLAFLDADDIWLPEKLQKQLQSIISTNADLVFSNAYIFEKIPIDKNNLILGLGDVEYNKTEVVDLFFKGNRIMILTVLVKREAISEVNGFNEDINIASAEDYHLWLKLLIHNKVFKGTKEALAAYRILPESASSQDRFSTLVSMDVLKSIAYQYPQTLPGIKRHYKSWIRKSFAQLQFSTSEFFNEKIKSSFSFIGYQRWLLSINWINKIFGRRMAIRYSYFIINYL